MLLIYSPNNHGPQQALENVTFLWLQKGYFLQGQVDKFSFLSFLPLWKSWRDLMECEIREL